VAGKSTSLFGAVRGSVRVLWRASRQLFHEATGTLFFLIAVSAIQSSWRAWHHRAGQMVIAVGAAYAVLMILFGVLSFRDARRVR
jgi:hypothetical protein